MLFLFARATRDGDGHAIFRPDLSDGGFAGAERERACLAALLAHLGNVLHVAGDIAGDTLLLSHRGGDFVDAMVGRRNPIPDLLQCAADAIHHGAAAAQRLQAAIEGLYHLARLLAQLLGLLQTPISGLARVIAEVAKQKGGGADAPAAEAAA